MAISEIVIITPPNFQPDKLLVRNRFQRLKILVKCGEFDIINIPPFFLEFSVIVDFFNFLSLTNPEELIAFLALPLMKFLRLSW